MSMQPHPTPGVLALMQLQALGLRPVARVAARVATHYASLIAALALILSAGMAHAQSLTPLTGAAGPVAPAPWRFVGVPGDKVAPAPLDLVQLNGQKVLRLATQNSYGTLVHPWNGPMAQLSWRWRLDQAPAAANLASKEGDDVPLKVCVSFDMPLADLSFSERTKLSLARALSGEKLPAATLCYIWDQSLAVGSVIANAYTQRVRFWVLNSGSSALGQWQAHQRDVQADFVKAFGHESKTVPAVSAVIVGADSDNTKGRSLAYVADIIGTAPQ